MRTRTALATVAMLLALAVAIPIGRRAPRTLVQWGWDEPDTAFLREHLPEMDRWLFDGRVFGVRRLVSRIPHRSSPTPSSRLEHGRAGRAHSILLAVERYQGQPSEFRMQPPAQAHGWDATTAQARSWGRPAMMALQEGCPSLTILLAFGHSLPVEPYTPSPNPLFKGTRSGPRASLSSGRSSRLQTSR